jgi:hypothetical protein
MGYPTHNRGLFTNLSHNYCFLSHRATSCSMGRHAHLIMPIIQSTFFSPPRAMMLTMGGAPSLALMVQTSSALDHPPFIAIGLGGGGGLAGAPPSSLSSTINATSLSLSLLLSSLLLDSQIKRLCQCKYLRECKVTALCLHVREILVNEGNVQKVAAPVMVSERVIYNVCYVYINIYIYIYGEMPILNFLEQVTTPLPDCQLLP